MDEERVEIPQEEDRYIPRPRWQVWAARAGLVIFLAGLALYYINLLRGGF